jgi:DnaJ-class molecular chaperone
MSSTKGKVQNEFVVEFKGCTTVREVKQVYRKLSKQWHPDMGGDAVVFNRVHEAYETAMKKVA